VLSSVVASSAPNVRQGKTTIRIAKTLKQKGLIIRKRLEKYLEERDYHIISVS
jgi:hypothetical protein